MSERRQCGAGLVGLVAVVLFNPAAAQAAAFVYGGHQDFAPWEFLDASGQPAGFNVDLVRALAAAGGHEVEVRLGPWEQQVEALEAGEIDLGALAWSEERAARLVYLTRFWTLRQSVVFLEERRPSVDPSALLNLDSLGAEVVAVTAGGLVQDLLAAMPEPQRPALLAFPDNRAALRALERGDATAVAGNGSNLVTLARSEGVGTLVEVPVKALEYHLVAHPDAAERLGWVAPALDRLTESGVFHALVEHHLGQPAAGGRAKWLTPLLGGLGLLLVLGLVHQVRLRRQDATLRRHSEGTTAALLKATPDMVFVLDPSDVITEYHAPDDAMLSVAPEEFLGRRAGVALPDVVGAQLLEAVAAARESGQAPPFEYRLPDRKGRQRYWEARAVRTRRGDVMVLTRDITEQKASRKRLERMRGALAERKRLALLGTIAAGVAHEVRNPLFAAGAALDALETHAGGTDEGRIIREQLGRISALTESLLELGRPHRAPLQPASMGDVAREAAERCAALGCELGVPVEIEVDDGVEPLPMAREAMVQAVRNLIDNAIRASPRQSSVLVRVATDAEHVSVSVTDRGEGIGPDHLEHIFEPFYSLRRGGSGLGLAIVQRVSRDHHGHVKVEPVPGGGTRFELRLSRSAAVADDDDAPS